MREDMASKQYQRATAIAGPTPKILHTLPEAIKLGRVRIVKKSNIVIILS
jgi:hypothetical protein